MPGPASTKTRTPTAYMSSICSANRTGRARAPASRVRISSGSAGYGRAVAPDQTGSRGARRSWPASAVVNASTAGAIRGLWKAAATGSRLAGVPGLPQHGHGRVDCRPRSRRGPAARGRCGWPGRRRPRGRAGRAGRRPGRRARRRRPSRRGPLPPRCAWPRPGRRWERQYGVLRGGRRRRRARAVRRSCARRPCRVRRRRPAAGPGRPGRRGRGGLGQPGVDQARGVAAEGGGREEGAGQRGVGAQEPVQPRERDEEVGQHAGPLAALAGKSSATGRRLPSPAWTPCSGWSSRRSARSSRSRRSAVSSVTIATRGGAGADGAGQGGRPYGPVGQPAGQVPQGRSGPRPRCRGRAAVRRAGERRRAPGRGRGRPRPRGSSPRRSRTR